MAMLINGQPGEQISALDRGLAYGDGIYRTIEIRDGQPACGPGNTGGWLADARRLKLPVPDEALLLDEISQLARPGAGRGQDCAHPWRGRARLCHACRLPATRMVSVTAWAGYPAERARDGVNVRWCDTRLACQPLLAGIKHLNRLENVLALGMVDPAIHEG
jgi:4-amino-4-deoxychorismate lyase